MGTLPNRVAATPAPEHRPARIAAGKPLVLLSLVVLAGFWLLPQAAALCLFALVHLGLGGHVWRGTRPGRSPAPGRTPIALALIVTGVANLLFVLNQAYPTVLVGDAVGIVYVGKDLLIGISLLRMVRGAPRSVRRPAAWDGALIACGATLMILAVLVKPVVISAGITAPIAAALYAHTVLDLLLYFALGRLVFASYQDAGLVRVTGAAVLLLVGDALLLIELTRSDGTPVTNASMMTLWFGGALLLASLATRPGVPRLQTADEVTSRNRLGLRIAVYAVLTVLVPAASLPVMGDTALLPPFLRIAPAAIAWLMSLIFMVRLGMLLVGARTALAVQRDLRTQLQHRAFHDRLTGLGNRYALEDGLRQAVEDDQGWALLLVGLDHFKLCNDSLGHRGGDALLTMTAERLTGLGLPGFVVTRSDGDEFALLLRPVATAGTNEIADAVLAAMRQPFTIDSRQMQLTASVGVLAPAQRAYDVSDILADAGIALQSAKQAGRDRVAHFTAALKHERIARIQLIENLHEALATGQFALHYQPVIDLETGTAYAAEALLRWSPGGTPISPAQFIPAAEESGLIVAIGTWVLREACRQASAWHRRHAMAITINASGQQLRRADFATLVVEALTDGGLPPTALVIEVTESELAATTPAEKAVVDAHLTRLRGLGVRIALDDFGTGYSSLSALCDLPVDIVKIDRTFVTYLDSPDPENRRAALARTVIDVGRSLGLRTIAEGVETVEQHTRLREMGCRYVQGFLFSRPLPADQLDAWLAADREPAAVQR